MVSILFSLRRYLQQFLVTLIFAALVFYFVYHLVSGTNGLFAMFKLSHQVEKQQSDLQRLSQEKKAWEDKVKLLYPETLDKDLLDEQARRVLGHAGPNEVIIFLKEDTLVAPNDAAAQ